MTMPRNGTRIIESVKLDSYVPQAPLCIRCHSEILDSSKAHYGRITVKWGSVQERNTFFHLHQGQVIATPVITERSFPEKVTGLCCFDCYMELWNTTWRSGPTPTHPNGQLRRAFEHVHREVIQPKNDDHDASKITKGLYAPHVVKGRKRNDDYFEEPALASRNDGSPVIEESDIKQEKLSGFNRSKRDDINLKPKRIVARNGKWKVSPDTYVAEHNRTLTKEK